MTRPAGQDHLVRLRLTCLQPSESSTACPTEFGLQDRAGNIHPGQVQPDGSLLYDVTVPVSRAEGNLTRFRGPYVQGPPAAPFLYLSVKRLERGPGEAPWVRRLKIPLPTLPWDDVDAAPRPFVVAACVSGAASGTVPLLDGGWVVQDAPSS